MAQASANKSKNEGYEEWVNDLGFGKIIAPLHGVKIDTWDEFLQFPVEQLLKLVEAHYPKQGQHFIGLRGEKTFGTINTLSKSTVEATYGKAQSASQVNVSDYMATLENKSMVDYKSLVRMNIAYQLCIDTQESDGDMFGMNWTQEKEEKQKAVYFPKIREKLIDLGFKHFQLYDGDSVVFTQPNNECNVYDLLFKLEPAEAVTSLGMNISGVRPDVVVCVGKNLPDMKGLLKMNRKEANRLVAKHVLFTIDAKKSFPGSARHVQLCMQAANLRAILKKFNAPENIKPVAFRSTLSLNESKKTNAAAYYFQRNNDGKLELANCPITDKVFCYGMSFLRTGTWESKSEQPYGYLFKRIQTVAETFKS